MPKAKTKAPTPAQASPTKTVNYRFNAGVAKVKDFGKNVGAKAKELGGRAKAHVSRNRAAYIAGGAGLAAGAAGATLLSRKKRAQSDD
jgi:hypothetical protein